MAFLDQGRDPTPNLPSDTESKLRNQVLSQLVTALLNVLPRTLGTFQLAAAATKTVTQPAVKANSTVVFVPTNAAAATLMSGAKSLYWDSAANVAGASFTVKTADGTNAVGTETFSYFVISPV